MMQPAHGKGLIQEAADAQSFQQPLQVPSDLANGLLHSTHTLYMLLL